MQKEIINLITDYVESYPQKKKVQTRWGQPLVAFASASDPGFMEIREKVNHTHALPQDFMPDAKTVITYFLPFERSIVDSNADGYYSSREWAVAYAETNRLIHDLNSYIADELPGMGGASNIIPATHNFDKERLMSDWSHRHVAYIAGLGRFGLHNLMITAKGCAGRLGSVITNLEIPPTPRGREENCLYKAKGTCKKCVERCVTKALTAGSFDRHKCYELLLVNADRHPDLGLADACGKCAVNLPCTFTNPVRT